MKIDISKVMGTRVTTLLRTLPEYADLFVATCVFEPPRANDPESSEFIFPTRKIRGTGIAAEQDVAELISFVEMLERYSASVIPRRMHIANSEELGDQCLSLERLPHCSRSELLHPQCPLIAPSEQTRVRWVLGKCLRTSADRFLPASLCYLSEVASPEDERIAVPISTGCAAAKTRETALLSGILEAIERDALALTWLQMLQRPRITIDCMDELRDDAVWNSFARTSSAVRHVFIDITTDLGIPTVLGIRSDASSTHAANVFACASSLSAKTALLKVIKDLAGSAPSYSNGRSYPTAWSAYKAVHHGATYMAHRERAAVLKFLSDSEDTVRLSTIEPPAEIIKAQYALDALLSYLGNRGLHCYALDLTTDEAKRCGIHVEKVIIPELIPLPFRYRARYLATRRLYDAPPRMGLNARSEFELNPWPLPFA